MRNAGFVLLLKLNTSKETWQHYLSWQVGGSSSAGDMLPTALWKWDTATQYWQRDEVTHSSVVLSLSLSRFLVPKSQDLGMSRVGWTPEEGRLWTSPEMWYSVLHVATVSCLFLIPACPFTQVSALLIFLWPLCPLCISSFSAINSYLLKKICIRHLCIDGTCRQTFVC